MLQTLSVLCKHIREEYLFKRNSSCEQWTVIPVDPRRAPHPSMLSKSNEPRATRSCELEHSKPLNPKAELGPIKYRLYRHPDPHCTQTLWRASGSSSPLRAVENVDVIFQVSCPNHSCKNEEGDREDTRHWQRPRRTWADVISRDHRCHSAIASRSSPSRSTAGTPGGA